MDDNSMKSIIIRLLRNFGTVFTLSILAISIAGLIVSRYAPYMHDFSTMFGPDGTGISYGAILQIASFSIIIAILSQLIIFEQNIIRIHFFLCIILLFFSAIITFSVFAIIFNWFPVEDPRAWLGFIICTLICFVLSIGLSLFMFNLEGKKCDKLLANYKRNKKARETA